MEGGVRERYAGKGVLICRRWEWGGARDVVEGEASACGSEWYRAEMGAGGMGKA